MQGFKLLVRFILVSPALLGLSVSQANAALVTELHGVNIDGTSYDITFHTGSTFNALWDVDGDGVFGENDTSLFDAAPTFWGSFTQAGNATDAIMAALGTGDTTSASFDSFLIPYQFLSSDPGTGTVRVRYDHDPGITQDVRGFTTALTDTIPGVTPYASFSVSPVPVPAAVWLFGTALIGLIGFGKRRKAA